MTPEEQALVRSKMQEIARKVQSSVPGYGFLVMVFPFSDNQGRCNYVSNARRDEVVPVLKEWIERNELPSSNN